MGRFACHCGYIISDSVYPCPSAGILKWETESEMQSEKTTNDVKEFFTAFENKRNEEWLRNYFGDTYPLNLDAALVIDDIYTKVSNNQGHSVYQCPECERIYLQKEFYSDEWTCFEKRK